MRPLTFRNKLVLAGALAVAVVAGVVFAIWPREPYYEGKPLSYWVDRLPARFWARNKFATVGLHFYRQTNAVAVAAIDALGPRCLPYLVQRLQSGDPLLINLETKLWVWAGRRNVHLFTAPFITASLKRAQAVTALLQLGDAVKPVVPKLVALAKTDPDPGVRGYAREVLRQVSPSDYEQVMEQTNLVSQAVH